VRPNAPCESDTATVLASASRLFQFCDASGNDSAADRPHAGQNFLPTGLEKFQRRAEDVAILIREAFLRGISTRQVGRIVATFTGGPVSAQTVFKLVTGLDQAVEQFHTVELKDEWAFLFLDGASLRMRWPAGRKRVHMPAAYAVKPDGTRHLLAFQRSSGESQQAWEGLLRISTSVVLAAGS
jgi:putative transposase